MEFCLNTYELLLPTGIKGLIFVKLSQAKTKTVEIGLKTLFWCL